MKKTKQLVPMLAVIVLAARIMQAQSTPASLNIVPVGTNQISVTITNSIGMADYDLQWTPALANPDYPWSFAAVGIPGGTNFILDTEGYQNGFFRAVLDTNAVPLWEQADPNNPSSPILTVTITSPANGANLNQ